MNVISYTLADRSFDKLRTGSEHGRRVVGYFSHDLAEREIYLLGISYSLKLAEQ